VATKVSDRGTGQAVGVVTDVGLFLDLLARTIVVEPAVTSSQMKRQYSDAHAAAGTGDALPEIETWANQYPNYEIEISLPEFTSVCPKTGVAGSWHPDPPLRPGQAVPGAEISQMYMLAYRQSGNLPGRTS